MKIISAIKSGAIRSVRAWKGILVFWLISLAMVSMVVVPLKASLNSAFGSSMVTEKLMKGINFDVLGDLGKNLHSFGSALFAGLFILSLLAVIVNVFVTGGLFDSLKKGAQKVTSENFFSSSAKNFWPFMLISVILYMIEIVLIVIVIVIPVSIAGNAKSAPEGIVFITFAVTFLIFMAGASITYLVADYARAWQVLRNNTVTFRALGFGFSQAFRTFLTSFPLMVILLLLQALPGLALIGIIAGYTPETRGGVILLFIGSQIIFLVKIFFKVVRYGSITSLMELNTVSLPQLTDNKPISDPENFTDISIELKPETNV